MNNENKDFFISDVEAEESLVLENNEPSASKVLYEDTSKRGKNVKHFRLQNGNFMAVIYDQPVHKLDPNTGKYVDIVSDVNETDTEYETVLDRFKVRMPKTDGKDRFVTVEKDGRAVSWKFVPRSASRRKKSVAAFSRRSKRDLWDAGDQSSVKYEKMDVDTDLQYDISDNGVKESIILTKNPDRKTFSFELKLKGLVPMLSEDKKTVSLFRDDEDLGSEPPEMTIPPAFMEDANEAFCNDIHYEIRKTNDSTFLDLVLDTDWLSESERVYPVVIDPRVEISRYNYSNLQLAEICSNGNDVPSMEAMPTRKIGVDVCGNVHRLYIGLNLPTLVEGFNITKAGLLLYHKYYTSYQSNNDNYMVAPVTNPDGKQLSVQSFNWSNVQGLNIGSTIDTLQGYDRRMSPEIEIDLTSIAKSWYGNNTSVDGERCLVIKKENEDPCCCNGSCVSTYLEVHSPFSEYRYRPKMYIEYTNFDVYADHQKYHTFEMGRAGTGSINLFTGRMSFAHGDVTAEGVKLPLSISHLYRHEYVGDASNSNALYGNGWKLSVEQTLKIINRHGIMAVYTDAQGKRHYFLYGETNANGELTDDAGLGLTYKEECGCVCGHATTHVLTDEKGNKMRFNNGGKLIQLIDANGNVSCLNYANGKLVSVVDGTNHSAQLIYKNDKLFRIVDNGNADRYVEYAYSTSGELETITYPFADSVYTKDKKIPLQTKFFYDSAFRLKTVVDCTGLTCNIEYDGDRVKCIRYSGNLIVTDGELVGDESDETTETLYDDPISFEYRAKSTAVINGRTNVKTVYRFDSIGREMSSYMDVTEIGDQSKISEATLTEISGYQSIVDNLEISKIGKYRSLSVSLNNDSADEVNLLQNGLFANRDSAFKPTAWGVVGAGNGASGFGAGYIQDTNSYYFSSSRYSKYLYQTVDLCNCQLNGNILVASAWAKAIGNVSAEAENSSAKYRLCLRVAYEGGEVDEYYENYDSGCDKWQYAAIPFVLNKECCPVSVTVKLDYTGNTGTCYFTNARLVAVDGISTTNTYKTDETPIASINVFGECRDIKMTTVKKDSVLTTTDYIDDRSDVVRTVVTDRNGRSYTTDYKYDSKHNLVKTQDYRGLVIEYTYNRYGKELTRKTYHKDTPHEYMFSEYTYQDDNFVASERDPRYSHNGQELKTTYQHDTKRNLLLRQTAVNGQRYDYSYDDVSDDLMSLSSTTDDKANENQFFYTRGYLTRVAHNGFNFGFVFDQLGRSKSVTVGDNATTTKLLEMFYSESGVEDITTTQYASGEKNIVTTDMFGNPKESKYVDANGNLFTISTATYDAVGKVKELVDKERGICYNYTYDAKGNVTKIVETNESTGAVLATNTFVFDANERLISKTYGAVGQTYRPVYENVGGSIYPDNEVIGVSLDGKFTDKLVKDGLRRATRKTLTVGSHTLFEENYGYLSTPQNGKTIATDIVSSVTSQVRGTSARSTTLNYSYDKAGNLETVSNGTTLIAKYYYDGLNRLKREDNHVEYQTYTWEYDVGGNILSKKVYALCNDINLGSCLQTFVYTYKTEGWRDRLHSYNGQICEYDHMGNPTKYRNQNLIWTKVRRLASYNDGAVTFEYGANGIRYRKNNTVYTLDGNKILRESDGTKTLTYYHGGSGIIGFNYNGTDYYFRKNLQGDVTEIYTSAGSLVADYAYDAWGKILQVNNYTGDEIGDLNPIRYRSYYYDVETGFYYLNSRYYDPEVGRFINADTTDVLENAQYDINGLNLYAYCDNNPVSGRDDEGDMSFWKKLAIATAVVVAVAVVAAAVTVATGGTATAALCAVASTFVGAAKGAVVGAVTGAVTGAAVGAVTGAVEGYQETGTFEGTLQGMGRGAAKGAVQGAQDGLLSGMVMGGIGGAMNPSFCFVAGTAVLTTVGKKAIETIQVGDTIPCVDHITGEATEKKVISTSINKVDRLIELDIDGEIIQCTETHPFQVKGKGWVNASDLKPYDRVYTKDWNTATVKSVNLLELDEPVEVFNFEVEDCHTYFVGECAVLVHNACQKHHIMSDKNKTYTPEFKKIADKYGLKLNGKVNGKKWNVFEVKNHSGRHSTEYHEFILKRVRSIDVVAGGNQDVFLKHFSNLANYVVNHPGILY